MRLPPLVPLWFLGSAWEPSMRLPPLVTLWFSVSICGEAEPQKGHSQAEPGNEKNDGPGNEKNDGSRLGKKIYQKR